jgi:hypothetical protein
MPVVVLPGEVDLHDVGVGQRGRCLGLTNEPLQEGGILAELLGEDLDGHEAVEGLVAAFVDHSHPSPAKLRNDLVRPDSFRHV